MPFKFFDCWISEMCYKSIWFRSSCAKYLDYTNKIFSSYFDMSLTCLWRLSKCYMILSILFKPRHPWMYLTFRFEYFKQSNNVRKSRKNFPCGQLAHDTIYNTRFKYRVGLKSPKKLHLFLRKTGHQILLNLVITMMMLIIVCWFCNNLKIDCDFLANTISNIGYLLLT